MAMYNARTREEIREIVEDLEYELLDEYIDRNYRRVVIQDYDGYKYDVELNTLIKGHPPYFVSLSNPFTLSHNIPLWLKRENKYFELCENNVYRGTREKLFFQCLKEGCQEIFDTSWDEIYNQGSGCPFCVGKRVGKRNNLAYRRPDLAKEWDYDKNEKTPEEYTEKSSERVFWTCSKCNHHWDAKISHRSNGSGCPECSDSQKESNIANELKTYLKENYNSIAEYKILKNLKTGYWLPFDVYIPFGKNVKLNGFYIEVHGGQHFKMCYWHKLLANKNGTTPEEELEYQRWKDEIKKTFANKNGVYIEIDLRKIKTTEEAIEYIENILKEEGAVE